jgi:transketolase
VRTAFFKALLEIAERDPRVALVTGDLGFGVVEPFMKRFPDRYLNAGVAEQNMTSIAAGMALAGRVVFTYSIGNFPTLRCLEQIRNDVCYHKADVKIVAVGGGFAYGALGMSHHATEDLAIFRSLPDMTVIAPGDPAETEEATRAAAARPGPCFLRLGRAGEPRVHPGAVPFTLGRALLVRDGGDLTLVSTGGMLKTAVDVAALLAAQGIHARVLSMHTLKPLDEEAVVRAARETSLVVTLEEHSEIGGLGGAVAEALAQAEIAAPWRLKRIGLPSTFAKKVGSQDYLKAAYGLTPDAIVKSLEPILAPSRKGR